MDYENNGRKFEEGYLFHVYRNIEGRAREGGFRVTSSGKVLLRASGLGHSGGLGLLIADGNAAYEEEEGRPSETIVDVLGEVTDFEPEYHYVPGSYERGDSHYLEFDLPAGTLYGFEVYSAEGTGTVEVVNPDVAMFITFPPGEIILG